MSISKIKKQLTESGYINRLLMSVLAIQVVVLCLFKFWPSDAREEVRYQTEPPRQEVLIDEIQITKQQSSPPPPPKPQIPQPVPNDEIMDIDPDFELDLQTPEMPELEFGKGTAMDGDEASIVSNPQIPPTVVRIVEASSPDGVPPELKGNIEMIVNFLVDKDGRVEEASIVEIRRYDGSGEYEVLEFIEYGLMDAVLRAALQWRFRPARQNGEPVRAYTRQRFNY